MDKAEILLDGVTFEDLVSDFRINFAVFRALEIVGEATKRLPMELRNEYPDVPWKEMAGMRDRIIHGYDSVSDEIIYSIVISSLPKFKGELEVLLIE